MKQKDYIEKLVLDNLNELNDQEPPEGHFERFEARLKEEGKIQAFSWNRVWRVAAAVVFVLLAVNQARIWLEPEEATFTSLANISPEYAEVEYFYTSSIQQGINSWNDLAAGGIVSEEENRIMQQELKDFEVRFEEIQQEFEANPHDERVIQAMLEYYQAKLNVITLIVSKLQEVQQQKMIRYEKEI
ncbi:MAG TPA: hypothetical protein DCY35_05130 [Prolixibacteraceae bacterium]|nr:hypothetical protein [Prolixibacteraceae bacterium]